MQEQIRGNGSTLLVRGDDPAAVAAQAQLPTSPIPRRSTSISCLQGRGQETSRKTRLRPASTAEEGPASADRVDQLAITHQLRTVVVRRADSRGGIARGAKLPGLEEAAPGAAAFVTRSKGITRYKRDEQIGGHGAIADSRRPSGTKDDQAGQGVGSNPG